MDTDQIQDKPPSAWVPTTDVRDLAILGKLVEEASELTARASRCIIQGPHEVDPDTGKSNLRHLLEEIADVQAQMNRTVQRFNLNAFQISRRIDKKGIYSDQWDMMLSDLGYH